MATLGVIGLALFGVGLAVWFARQSGKSAARTEQAEKNAAALEVDAEIAARPKAKPGDLLNRIRTGR
jgi:mannose/fructose/N-acetylgalactosamine-specific phosphotransferase system component IIC